MIVGSAKSNSLVCYKNLFTTSLVTVTASTEASGFEKENAYDGLSYDAWKPATTGDSWIRASFGISKMANYMAIWGHDIGDHGSNIRPQYSTDGGSTWNDAALAVATSDNNTILVLFDDIIAGDWRVLINNPTSIAEIGGVQIGEITSFERGMNEGFAPSLVPMIKYKTAKSESGAFIGGSKVSQGIEGNINLTNLTPAWVRDEWLPFIDHVQTPQPFVFAWDGNDYPGEAILCWGKGKIANPRYSSPLYMSASLAFEGNL